MASDPPDTLPARGTRIKRLSPEVIGLHSLRGFLLSANVRAAFRRLFDSIPQAPLLARVLLARVAERVSDGRVLALVESYLGQDVLHGLERWTPSGHPPGGG